MAITGKNWKETKREYTVDENGYFKISKVTEEENKSKIWGFERKDFFDIVLKSVGLLAIFIPLILFYISNKNEIKKERGKLQYETYSAVLTELTKAGDPKSNIDEFKNALNNLDKVLRPKVYIISEEDIRNRFEEAMQKVYYIKKIIDIKKYCQNLIIELKKYLTRYNPTNTSFQIDSSFKIFLTDKSAYESAINFIQLGYTGRTDNTYNLFPYRWYYKLHEKITAPGWSWEIEYQSPVTPEDNSLISNAEELIYKADDIHLKTTFKLMIIIDKLTKDIYNYGSPIFNLE